MGGWLEETRTEDEERRQQWGVTYTSFRPRESCRRDPGSSHLERIPAERAAHRVEGTTEVYLWSRRGGRFRELTQRKPHLWGICTVDIPWGASPKNPPMYLARKQALGIHLKEGWQLDQSTTIRQGGLCSFPLMPGKAEATPGIGLS